MFHSSCFFLVPIILFNDLVDHATTISLELFQSSIEISSCLTTLQILIFFKTTLTYPKFLTIFMTPTMRWTIILNHILSHVILIKQFTKIIILNHILSHSLNNLQKLLHMSLISSSFTDTLWSSLLLHLNII